MSSDTFTLFVVLPDESVCTLRNLTSGINIEEIKARLELSAGLPSHIYSLVYPDGEKLEDHKKLLMQENIKDGYVLKVLLSDHWETLYLSVSKNNIESVYHNGGVHLKGNMVINADESGKVENMVYDRGCVALYMASYLGLLRMCNMLTSVGIDTNGSTQFGRTALHAAASKDNIAVLQYLIDKGAKLNVIDLFGKSALDVAQSFSSHMCEKTLKILQLNLRGRKTQNRTNIRCVVSLSDSKINTLMKESMQRPKSLVDDRNKGNHHVQKIRPKTDGYPRQLHVRTFKGNRSTVASISIQDSSSKYKGINSKSPGFYKFQNTMKMDNMEEEVITCKPLPLLKKKSCLKFAPDEPISRSTQTTPVVTKLDISTTPMLFAPPSSRQNTVDVAEDEVNTSVDERGTSARTRSSKSTKLVSFSKKDRPSYPELSETSRVMKRRINIVASRSTQKINQERETSTPQRTGVIHDRWADRKKILNKNVRAEISSSDEESDDFDDDDSGNESDANAEAYDAWVKRKQLESKRMPRKITRPIHDIIKIGSTEVGDGRNPPTEHNLTAYRDWLDRRRQNRRVPNLERIKSMKDFMSQKKLLEEKRQKLLMNAISYDEWMDHEFDRKALIRRILKADYEQLKAMEFEKLKSRAPKQISHEKWQEEVEKNDELERKKKEIYQTYNEEKEKWRQEVMKSTATVLHNDWIRKTSSQPRVLMRSNSKGSPENDVKRAVEADRAYQEWIKRKHSNDVLDIQRKIDTERDMINSYRQRQDEPTLAC